MARITDQTLAREALDALRNCKSVRLSVRGGQTVRVPDSALGSFLATLEAVADGSTVEVVRTEAEVSTQQAARILNVSRPTAVDQPTAGRPRAPRRPRKDPSTRW